jgi:hypothetical protein
MPPVLKYSPFRENFKPHKYLRIEALKGLQREPGADPVRDRRRTAMITASAESPAAWRSQAQRPRPEESDSHRASRPESNCPTGLLWCSTAESLHPKRRAVALKCRDPSHARASTPRRAPERSGSKVTIRVS